MSDEGFFLGAYLTKPAFTAYKKKYSSQKLSESVGNAFLLSDWKLELVKTDSEEVFTSYADKEVRLIISELKPDSDSKLSPKSFIENMHRDNDIKMQISRMNLEEFREQTEMFDMGDLSRYEESKRNTVVKDSMIDVELQDNGGTAILTMKEILKSETPGAKLIQYEPPEESSSFHKKREIKEERKTAKTYNPANA